MPGWPASYDPAIADISSIAFHRPFQRAMDQRDELLGGRISPFIEPAAGDILFRSQSITGGTFRRYREFAILASTTYTNGAAFADGHKARCIEDTIVYHRVAGVWAPTNDPVPDQYVVSGSGVNAGQRVFMDYVVQRAGSFLSTKDASYATITNFDGVARAEDFAYYDNIAGATAPNLKDAHLSGVGFTHKRYREFDGVGSATTYNDGSAFADGHKGRDRLTTIVYERVAGAWVVTSEPVPDIVTLTDQDDGGAVGDIVHYDNYAKIQAGLQGLVWLSFMFDDSGQALRFTTVFEEPASDGFAGSGSGSTWANAKTAADADYSDTGSVGTLSAPISTTRGIWNSASSFSAHKNSRRRSLIFEDANLLFLVSGKADFYAYIAGGVGSGSVADGPWSHFNAFNIVTLNVTGAQSGGFGTWTSGTYGTTGAMTWCAEPTIFVSFTDRGWANVRENIGPGVQGQFAIVVLRMNVAGAFQQY